MAARHANRRPNEPRERGGLTRRSMGLERRHLPLVLACLVALLACSLARAQSRSLTESFPEQGVQLELPRTYKWLPVQPNEPWVVLQWINPELAIPSRLQVVRIDYVRDAGPPMPDENGELPEPASPVINSWSRYCTQALPRWTTSVLEVGEPQGKFKAREYELLPSKPNGERGWAYVWDSRSTRTYALLGWTTDLQFEAERKDWRATARKFVISEPEPDPRTEEWRRFYKGRPRFKDAQYRIRVRAGLRGNWKHEDTENYIVVYNTKDQPLVSRIARDLESMRTTFLEFFPPDAEMTSVSTVRLCADRREYLDFGGQDWTEGYWSADTQELVLYDSTQREKAKRTDNSDTFRVLYHEAFHQFIHHSAGRLAPHSWFDEGFGDYFGGAIVKGGKLFNVGLNSWREPTISKALENKDFTPWREIIWYERDDFYGKRTGHAYAQAWSMVYFLNESSVVRRHTTWSEILPRYFAELKDAWANELGVLRGDGNLEDDFLFREAQKRARGRAVQAGFDGVQLEELEAAWLEFMGSLSKK